MEINEKRVQQQVRNFEKALKGYSKTEPLARYLTRFFKENKQMGSSDRRMTSRFCYNYFRLGHALTNASLQERLVCAEFLSENQSSLVALYQPEWNKNIDKDVKTKIGILQQSTAFKLEDVFPFIDYLSLAIDKEDFLLSQFVQPDLFIRIKRGEEEFVKKILSQDSIDFKEISKHTLALPNGTKLQNFPKLEGKFEVQDLSSQSTIEFMKVEPNESWWDACAASGGKSLMFLDAYPKVNLLVSDLRLSILRNLDERFLKANVKQYYRKKIIDLSREATHILADEKFDGIILDAPCSGSGTWGRTPEMIQQFSLEKLIEFSDLQKKIVSNVIPHLKENGSLVYITCSVYQQENDQVVDYILKNFNLKLDVKALIKGYNNKADSMFAARFIKN